MRDGNTEPRPPDGQCPVSPLLHFFPPHPIIIQGIQICLYLLEGRFESGRKICSA